MAKDSVLKLPSEIPEGFPLWSLLVGARSMMDQQEIGSVNALTVTSIVETAEAWHVSMVARITPVLETVKIDFKVA
jgi:hypothetical protein